MAEFTIDPNYTGTPDLNIKLKSITANLDLFEAEWTIPADYFADAPITETNYTTFKANYITDGSTPESLNIDLNQWALDMGFPDGSRHLFTIEMFLEDGDCVSLTKSFNYRLTVADAIPFDSKILESGIVKITESGDIKIIE